MVLGQKVDDESSLPNYEDEGDDTPAPAAPAAPAASPAPQPPSQVSGGLSAAGTRKEF